MISAVSSALPPDLEAAIRPNIRISPFSYRSLDESEAEPAEAERRLGEHLEADFLLTDSGRQALGLILDDVGVGPSDVVTIVTTTGGSYVSRCVTDTIEARCAWSMERVAATRAILVVHEWGRACESISGWLGLGLPVIEDCAYAFASRFADGSAAGSKGDYALYSLPKMFSVNFGGIAVNRARPLASDMPVERRSYLLGRIGAELAELPAVLGARDDAWQDLRKRFGELGAEPYFASAEGDRPAVFMAAHDPARIPLADIRSAYEAHGVEAGVFYGHDAFYVPCHHQLGPQARQYLADIYADLLTAHGGAR